MAVINPYAVRTFLERYNLPMTYTLTIEEHGGSFNCKLGDFAATGQTREAALGNLVQRLAGAPAAQRETLWAGGKEAARGSKAG